MDLLKEYVTSVVQEAAAPKKFKASDFAGIKSAIAPLKKIRAGFKGDKNGDKSGMFASIDVLLTKLKKALKPAFKASIESKGDFSQYLSDWIYDVVYGISSPDTDANFNSALENFTPKMNDVVYHSVMGSLNEIESVIIPDFLEAELPKLRAALDIDSTSKKSSKSEAADKKKYIKEFIANFEERKAEFRAAATAAAEALSQPLVAGAMKKWFAAADASYAVGMQDPLEEKFPEMLDLKSIFGNLSMSKEWTRELLLAHSMKEFKRLATEMMTQGTGSIIYREVLEQLKGAPALAKKIAKFSEKEADRIEKAATAPPKAPLGRIAFAPRRSKKPYEPNTPEEETLFRQIKRQFEDNKPFDAEVCGQVRRYLAKGWYSDVFKEPGAAVVYRGMGITRASLNRWLLRVLKMKELPKNNGSAEVNYRYTPKSQGASSWTTSKTVANDFSMGKSDYAVIFHARVEDNPNMFVTGPGGLYNIDGFETYETEKEAIGLGTIRIFKVEWHKND